NASLNQPPPRFAAAINPSLCRLPAAIALAPKPIALLSTRPPPQPNPHSQMRGAFRAPSPAGSFLRGFRTPAQMHVAPTFMAGIRNPAQSTKPVRLRARTSRPQFLGAQTLLTHASTSPSGHGTKSLRSSPLRGGKSREAGNDRE